MAEFAPDRYDTMAYRRCGDSGLKLPLISLGFWQALGEPGMEDECRRCAYYAFDHGITHFDLANNYGPPPGNSEEIMGEILKDMPRDELIVSTKAGYRMWPGPYGDGGSKKYLVASLDQSLKRLGLDYVDIFYHHRPDGETPMEESLGALNLIVQQGKALVRRRQQLLRGAVQPGRGDRPPALTGRRSRSTSLTTTCAAPASRPTCCRTPRLTAPASSPSAPWPAAT